MRAMEIALTGNSLFVCLRFLRRVRTLGRAEGPGSRQVFQLAMPVELGDPGGIVAPVALHFHGELEIDFHAENLFQFAAAFAYDFLYHLATPGGEGSPLVRTFRVGGRLKSHQARR